MNAPLPAAPTAGLEQSRQLVLAQALGIVGPVFAEAAAWQFRLDERTDRTNVVIPLRFFGPDYFLSRHQRLVELLTGRTPSIVIE